MFARLISMTFPPFALGKLQLELETAKENYQQSLVLVEPVHQRQAYKCRRGAMVKGVEHISTIVLVNICVARVRVQLVLSAGI